MGLIDLTADLDNMVASHYSDARGPVIRGKHTELTMVHFEADDGAREHSHAEEQFIVVLEGLLRVYHDSEVTDVDAGQAFFVPSGSVHSTKALTTVRAISFKNLVNPSYDATADAAAS